MKWNFFAVMFHLRVVLGLPLFVRLYFLARPGVNFYKYRYNYIIYP